MESSRILRARLGVPALALLATGLSAPIFAQDKKPAPGPPPIVMSDRDLASTDGEAAGYKPLFPFLQPLAAWKPRGLAGLRMSAPVGDLSGALGFSAVGFQLGADVAMPNNLATKLKLPLQMLGIEVRGGLQTMIQAYGTSKSKTYTNEGTSTVTAFNPYVQAAYPLKMIPTPEIGTWAAFARIGPGLAFNYTDVKRADGSKYSGTNAAGAFHWALGVGLNPKFEKRMDILLEFGTLTMVEKRTGGFFNLALGAAYRL